VLTEFDRRQFLSRGLAAVGATWTAAHWPAVLSAAEYAHKAAASPDSQKFEFFTPAEAKEIEALSSCIIPNDGTPGALEAGVVYFIERALVTFSVNDQKTYREGLPELQKRVVELFPGVASFSAASPEQQEAILESLDEAGEKAAAQRPQRLRYRPSAAAQPLFEVLRVHTIAGFLIDPDVGRKGNRNGLGWTVINRLPEHAFQPPFGFYDQGYPGWHPLSASATPVASSEDSGKEMNKK
jgi:gluconate 2-dehydrogenase gamma chain